MEIKFPKKYKNKHDYLIVEFTNYNTGKVISDKSEVYRAGHISERWTSCLDTQTWEPIEDEPTNESGGGSSDYYKLPENIYELQDLIEYKNMNFAIGNIFKACFRLGSKNDDMYEIDKIIWFAEREKKRLEGKQNESK